MGAIQINSVGKIYPNGTRALEDVNIEINDGEFVVPVSYTHLTLPTIYSV